MLTHLHRILSEDDLHLLEIPEPPTIVGKADNRSSIGSGSVITSIGPKVSSTKDISNKSQQQLQQHHHHQQHDHHQYSQSQSSIAFENENMSNIQATIETASTADVKTVINHLKNCIQKLQCVNLPMIIILCY